MNKTLMDRFNRLFTEGVAPKYIRCYDNGGPDAKDGSCDRYTVVYTRTNDRICHYVGMSGAPYHPQGFGQHGESEKGMIDRPKYSHLGKPIKFTDLPKDCQHLVISDYCELHNLIKTISFISDKLHSLRD